MACRCRGAGAGVRGRGQERRFQPWRGGSGGDGYGGEVRAALTPRCGSARRLLPVTAGFCLGGTAVRTGLAFFFLLFFFYVPESLQAQGPVGAAPSRSRHFGGKTDNTMFCVRSSLRAGEGYFGTLWGEEVALFTCVNCAVTWLSASQAAAGRRRGPGSAASAPPLPAPHVSPLFASCSRFVREQPEGRSRNSPRGSRFLPPLFPFLFGGAVPRCRRLERSGAELRSSWDSSSAPNRLLCVSGSRLASGVASPLPRQLSVARSGVGRRGGKGGGRRNLGICLVRSQQPGPAL